MKPSRVVDSVAIPPKNIKIISKVLDTRISMWYRVYSVVKRGNRNGSKENRSSKMPEPGLQSPCQGEGQPDQGRGKMPKVRHGVRRNDDLPGEQMSAGYRKRQKAIEQCISDVGFTLLRVRRSGSGHFKCRIRDDKGNTFTACTGTSCSSDQRRAHLNFKQDLRRLSNRAKGLIG